MKLHPRHHIVTQAELELAKVLLEWQEKHDLTFIETSQILLKSVDSQLRYALRMERHGTTEKKADEE